MLWNVHNAVLTFSQRCTNRRAAFFVWFEKVWNYCAITSFMPSKWSAILNISKKRKIAPSVQSDANGKIPAKIKSKWNETKHKNSIRPNTIRIDLTYTFICWNSSGQILKSLFQLTFYDLETRIAPRKSKRLYYHNTHKSTYKKKKKKKKIYS